MNFRGDFDRTAPLTWVGSFPVYLATAIAAGLLASMVVAALAIGMAGPSSLEPFVFTVSEAVRGGQIWRFVTYCLVNPPSIWTLIQILLLGMFGREVEAHMGRRAFLGLYVCLVLAVPVLYAALGFWLPVAELAGSSLPNFGVFLAFVLLYPRAEIFFGLQARWIAVALLGINTLTAFAARDFPGMAGLWWVGGAAWLYLRWQGAGFPRIPWPRGPRKRQVPVPKAPIEDVHGSIDPILEKISRFGFASLSKEERARLDRAREALLEKEGRNP